MIVDMMHFLDVNLHLNLGELGPGHMLDDSFDLFHDFHYKLGKVEAICRGSRTK